MNIKFETDYAFQPTPAGFAGIPEEYHAGIQDGSLHLVLRRCVTPNRWCIVTAVDAPDVNAAWPSHTVEHRLDEMPDLMLFSERDWSRECVDYGPHMASYIPMASTNAFSDAGKPLWTRYQVDPTKQAKHKKRREKAVLCAASFNAHAGKAPCAVEDLSSDALAMLRLQHGYNGEKMPVWMHRSLADAVLQAVRAGHAQVTADGTVESNEEAVALSKEEWSRRGITLTWDDPEHIRKRIEALESNPRRRFSNFKGKYPETPYSMRNLY
jgi:NADH:ubiquinone oxidoreductase subunit